MRTQPPGEAAKAQREIRSAIYWTLLGLIIERPGLYAYQLAKRYIRECGDSLPVSGDSHLYAGLDALLEKGLIEVIPGTERSRANGKRQPKPGYRATAEGIRAYREWLRTQVHEDRRHARLFARQLVALAGHPTDALVVIESLAQAALEEASAAKTSSARPARPDDASGLTHELELEERRLVAEAKLEYAEYARRKLQALARRGDDRDGPAA